MASNTTRVARNRDVAASVSAATTTSSIVANTSDQVATEPTRNIRTRTSQPPTPTPAPAPAAVSENEKCSSTRPAINSHSRNIPNPYYLTMEEVARLFPPGSLQLYEMLNGQLAQLYQRQHGQVLVASSSTMAPVPVNAHQLQEEKKYHELCRQREADASLRHHDILSALTMITHQYLDIKHKRKRDQEVIKVLEDRLETIHNRYFKRECCLYGCVEDARVILHGNTNPKNPTAIGHYMCGEHYDEFCASSHETSLKCPICRAVIPNGRAQMENPGANQNNFAVKEKELHTPREMEDTFEERAHKINSLWEYVFDVSRSSTGRQQQSLPLPPPPKLPIPAVTANQVAICAEVIKKVEREIGNSS